MKRIVVYGGTFDPIHNGHLAVARSLLGELDADNVVIVPAGRPWLRTNPPVAPPEARLTMARLATEGEPGIEVSDVDVIRPGTTYSIDTITDLRRMYGDEQEYFLAIGSDSAAELHRWHHYGDLVNTCRIAVVQRPGAPLNTDARMPSETVYIEGPMIDVSASSVRKSYRLNNIHIGRSRVPSRVHEFIIESEVYRRDSSSCVRTSSSDQG